MAIRRFRLAPLLLPLLLLTTVSVTESRSDTNSVFSPCADAKTQRKDGFSFGLAFAAYSKLWPNSSLQLSPCDQRLSLATENSQVVVFRPKVDEISILTVNTSSFSPDAYGGYMVAFAGRKYAARSRPVFVANDSLIVTSFTLVLEFNKGILQNLYWKRFGCGSCSGKDFVCLNNQDCAVRTNSCKSGVQDGKIDCSLGIQLAFSGTDKHHSVLNSWYEVKNLRQYSLFSLYSNLRSSLTSEFDKLT